MFLSAEEAKVVVACLGKNPFSLMDERQVETGELVPVSSSSSSSACLQVVADTNHSEKGGPRHPSLGLSLESIFWEK